MQIAAEVVGRSSRRLEVVGVTAGEGNGSYAELLLRDHADGTTRRPIMIGVARNKPEAELRRQIAERLGPGQHISGEPVMRPHGHAAFNRPATPRSRRC